MILKSITLHNYRQHKDLTVDFSGSLIAICGSNGSGKSNFLGSIQFALTGEQPGFNKDDLLSWGEESGYVDLSFTHNGHDCRIQRRIEKPAVTFVMDGEKVSGAKKVAEALEACGIDKDVLRQSVFVRQTEIESVLFTDPRERELAFQKLIGLGDAAKHNKFLTDFLSAVEKPRDFSQEIASHTEQISEQKKQLDALQKHLSEIEEKLSLPEYANLAETGQKKIEVLRSRISLVEKAKMAWDSLDACIAEEQAAIADAKDAVEVLDENRYLESIMALTAELETAKSAFGKSMAASKLREDLASLEKTLAEIGDLTGRIAKEDRLNRRRIEAEAEIAQLNKLLADAPDGNVCPLCGSTTNHNIRTELIEKIEPLEDEIKRIKIALLSSTLSRDVELKSSVELEISQAKAKLSAIGAIEKTRKFEEVSLELDDAKAEYARVHKANEETRKRKTRLDLARSRREQAQAALEATLSEFPSRPKDKEQLSTVVQRINMDMDAVFSALNALSEIKAQKANLDGSVSQLRLAMLTEQNALEQVERLQEENKEKTKKLQVIDRVKNWFAYKNGPRVMTQAIMGMLVEETNKYLTQFGTAFTVTPMEEGMGFRCVFNDGRKMPQQPPEASILSGGQKIALAVAFRFAVYSMFAGKLGLLSLDEPTAYLDDATIGRFGDILSKIRDLAENMGLQVLFATHETSILGNADQIITIGK